MASHPLITAQPTTTVEKAVEIMLKNKIRKLPIVDSSDRVIGIVTVTDLAMFLLPTRKLGLTSSILRAVSRGKGHDVILAIALPKYSGVTIAKGSCV